MDYGTLRVTTPDGQVREYPLNTESVFVGRADSNRVVIDHISVSRRHARFIFSGDQVQLEDLGSASGTFVGSERLAPETPRAIKPGDILRFGDAQAVFTSAVAAAPEPVVAATPEVVVASPPPPPPPPVVRSQAPTEQAVVVSLVSPSSPVAVGATTTATFVIENRGAEADRLAITVQNLPEGWSRVTRPSIDLPPGGRDEVTIILQPPRSAEATAGEHPLAVAATSQLRGIEVRALGRLTILPFGGHSIELTPPRSTGAFTLKVTNDGNAPLSVALSGRDADSALAITLTPPSLDLAPGEQRPARVMVRPVHGHFFGSERILPFEIQAQDAAAKAVTASGELRSRPPWLTVRWFVAAGAAVAVAAGAFFAYKSFTGDDNSKAGNTATATSTTARATVTTANPSASTTAAASTTATAATTAAGTATPTTARPSPTPTLLPSVTPPSSASHLGSGMTVRVTSAVNLTAEPSGSASVIQRLKVGDRLIVVTNTPASSTVYVTEGLIFWRVVIEGTSTVGWVPETTSVGDLRFLEPVP